MSFKYLIFLSFLAAFAVPSKLLGQALTTPIDEIVAVVNEDVILRSELDQALEGIRRQYRGREAQLPPREVLERQVLERLTLVRLQVQRAEESGVRITDTEVDGAIANILRQNGIDITQLQRQLEADGFTLAEFRKTLREELMVQRLRQRVIDARGEVSPSELEIALASGVHRRGEVRLALILIGVPDGATAAQIETARRKAEGVRKLIVDDGAMDFTAAAIRYSDGPQALEGGDLGWRRYDQLPPSFTDLLLGMEVGEVSQPLRTPSGFYLLKVVDKRDTSQIVVTEYNPRRILVKVNELQSEEDAQRSIQRIHERLRRGEDFGKLARELSEDEATAPLSGDMGWFALSDIAPEFGELLTSLEDGGYSEPFRTPEGWMIIQRAGSRQIDRTEDYVRNQVRESLRQRKGEDAYEQFLRQLRGEAYIEYRLGGAAS
jgi:peptidyl-prolyl cis-trans isomerase SurA